MGARGVRLCRRRLLAAALVLLSALAAARASDFDPCTPITAIRRTEAFRVGLVFWPGGLEQQWGTPGAGLQPCDPAVQANLTAQGAMFASYNVRADRLTVLKTSFPEELILTSRAPNASAKVISVVAFRYDVRSEARYVTWARSSTSSFTTSPAMTAAAASAAGASIPRAVRSTTLSAPALKPAAPLPALPACRPARRQRPSPRRRPRPRRGGTCCKALCHGRRAPGARPWARTCLPPRRCALRLRPTPRSRAAMPSSPSAPQASINLAFDGVDANSAAFTTAAQVRKLTSFSLVSLYFKAKETFFEVKDMFTATAGEYWGNFGAAQADIQAAYSGNAAANTDAASSGQLG